MTDTSPPREDIWHSGDDICRTLTIAIPTYKDNPARLIAALAKCDRAEDACLLVYDDGSNDQELTETCKQEMAEWPGTAILITADRNAGRAHARNRLLHHLITDWILFLDADMLPDGADFLSTYFIELEAARGPALIAGGFSLKQARPTPDQSLHAAQSLKSECLSASVRAEEPGRFVFTSNILVHWRILEAISFDDGFVGWGWEDVDWGLRVAANFPVIHIDNTATHLGLDDTQVLLRKYGNSGANFARMAARHPVAARAMSLTKAAKTLSRIPGRPVLRAITKFAAKSPLPLSARLQALKLYRAAAYAEHMK